MLLAIKSVLNANQLAVVRQLLQSGEFVDGKLTAGKEAVRVKNNAELSRNSPLHDQLNQIVMMSLLQNTEYQSFAFPHRVATPFYSRYTPGMHYGFHVDDPIMGPVNGRYRSDVSTTIFLNDKSEYTGGELVIKTLYGEQKVKLNAGDAVVYPATSLHKVESVTEGERLVAVTWAQSMVRDAEQRVMLYELGQAREKLMNDQPEASETAQVSNVYANLVRRWSSI